MKCPNCNSTQTFKNGHRQNRQCYAEFREEASPRNLAYKCKQCGRQFLESYRPWRYSDDVKQLCIKMYLNGMGLRGIERVTGIHNTTVMHWIRAAGHQLNEAPESEEIPEVTDLDELQTVRLSSRPKPLWATNATNSGFGQQLITSKLEFWHG